VMDRVRPEAVYHLAGLASVGESWKNLAETLRVNTAGFLNLVAAGRETGRPAILTVGSAEIYGRVDESAQPIGEDTPANPISPYALSKLWQEEAARYALAVDGYPVVITRPFNHTGPRQSRAFVASDFAAQLAEIELGRREPVIEVGNLTGRRDFLDVRDVARAYRLALVKGRRGVPYNIASGRPVAISRLLDTLRGLCRVPTGVREVPERLRPVDIPLLSGDASRLTADTGWTPALPIEKTLGDLLDHWRGVLGAGA
jgi:GDP-4-dehydro-6-deoxy-D-mannose reductase